MANFVELKQKKASTNTISTVKRLTSVSKAINVVGIIIYESNLATCLFDF